MKEFKKQLAYMWKHREAAVGLIIILLLLLSGLLLLEIVIDQAL